MFLSLFGRKNPHATVAAALYDAAVRQARQPVFYEKMGIPDTPEGRFDLICVHAYLAMARASACAGGGQGGALAQAVFDHMFREMDRALREMGAGDLGVPRRVRRLMQGFNGRAAAYAQALKFGSQAAVEEALRRNLYALSGQDENVRRMAVYVLENAVFLKEQRDEAVAQGIITFKGLDHEETGQHRRAAA